MQFLQRRVAHHARVLDDGFSRLVEDGHHLVVDAVALHAAAAVVQEYDGAVVLQFVLEEIQRLITKIQFGGIVVRKVSLHINSCCFVLPISVRSTCLLWFCIVYRVRGS